MNMTPMPAPAVLDAFFLDIRSRLLDVAASLDRLDRGASAESVANDVRLARIHRAVAALADSGPGRAEKIQQIFSLAYDENWPLPQPK
ncbi:MAG: hypothetical protein U0798_00485 [Gemmataceae bacterium]